ncbi:unnamed protein product [Rhizoctonia solani]|uniref:Exocyst complex component Sec8 n=1 Tax=Rhizoctonia solani TaxID=456999 RepID=A0A8H3HUA4_9AGAM|nr:unnamed protein product [Rhizoctonia solani]
MPHALAKYLTDLKMRPAADVSFSVSDDPRQSVVDPPTSRTHSRNPSASAHPASVVDSATAVKTPDNIESDSFLYIEMLLEALAVLGALGGALDAVNQRLGIEIFTLVESVISDVHERAEFVRRGLEQSHPGSGNMGSGGGIYVFVGEGPGALRLAALEGAAKKADHEILRDMCWTLYSKLDAVVQGLRVVSEVSDRIASRRDFKDTSGSNPGQLFPLANAWSSIRSEVRNLLHEHITDEGSGATAGRNPISSINEILRTGKFGRDKSKGAFHFADTDPKPVNRALRAHEEGITQVLRSTVPGLITTLAGDTGAQFTTGPDASEHRLLVRPDAFHVSVLFQPTLAFLERAAACLPDGVAEGAGETGGGSLFLDDFVVRVYLPQLEEKVSSLFHQAVGGLDAFQEDTHSGRISEQPLVKASMQLMALINSLCIMLQATPLHRENYARLILGVIIQFYQRCYERFLDLVSRSAFSGEISSIAATWAQRPEVAACLGELYSTPLHELSQRRTLCKQETRVELTFLANAVVEKEDLLPHVRDLTALGSLYRSLLLGMKLTLEDAPAAVNEARASPRPPPSPRSPRQPPSSPFSPRIPLEVVQASNMPSDGVRLPLSRAMAQSNRTHTKFTQISVPHLRVLMSPKEGSSVALASFNPVSLALALLDESSVGRDLDSFRRTKGMLERALKGTVDKHYQAFAASLPHHNKLISLLSDTQKHIAETRACLTDARAALSHQRADLVQFWSRGQTIEEMLRILDEIERLKNIPDQLESLMSEKKLLQAALLLVRSQKTITNAELMEIGALTDLRLYLSGQETALRDIMIEELHAHLYLKSFWCESRWAAYKPGQDSLPDLYSSSSSNELPAISSPDTMPHALAKYLTDLKMRPAADVSFSVSEDRRQSVVDPPTSRTHSRNPSASAHPASVVDSATAVKTPDNIESDSFLYIEMLLEALAVLGALGGALDALVNRTVDDAYIHNPSQPNGTQSHLDGIQYHPAWSHDNSNSNQFNSTYSTSTKASSNLAYFFRGGLYAIRPVFQSSLVPPGDAIYYYGETGGSDHGPVKVYLDGDTGGEMIYTNTSTPSIQYQQLLWNKTNLGSGDHQIIVSHQGQAGQVVGLDYLIIESTNATGFTPSQAGPAASDIPPGAIIVDDNNLQHFSYNGWEDFNSEDSNSLFYNHTLHRTTVPGTYFTFNFTGTAAWYITDMYKTHAVVSVTLDGQFNKIANSFSDGQLSQRIIWEAKGLEYGKHTVVVKHEDNRGLFATVDYFMYLPGESSQKPKSSAGPIAGGVVGGIALIALCIAAYMLIRRRRATKSRSHLNSDVNNAYNQPPLLLNPGTGHGSAQLATPQPACNWGYATTPYFLQEAGISSAGGPNRRLKESPAPNVIGPLSPATISTGDLTTSESYRDEPDLRDRERHIGPPPYA